MTTPTSGALTLERGLGLLRLVAHGTVRLDELAAASGLSRSATHRMLTSLVTTRFLTLSSDGRYRLGVALLELGSLAEREMDLPSRVQQLLAGIAAELGDATHLGILDGTDILYLAKARGRRGIDMASRPGARFRAQHTAMGKALLAHAEPAVAATYFDPAERRTERSLANVNAFAAALGKVATRGFALDDQENELGITCVAVAIADVTGEYRAAVSVSAPSVFMTPERIADVAAVLSAAAPEIGAHLTPDFAEHWL